MNVLQWAYSLGLRIDRRFTSQKKLVAPVISIGNIALGGRAKTPMVVELCQLLKNKYHVVVLTRGYGRKTTAANFLTREMSLDQISVETSGDEPLEIFLKTECPVLIGPRRFENALLYIQEHVGQRFLFILDDGFQHWDLERDFDLVLTSESDFSDTLLPTGRLREATSALTRADMVLSLEKDLEKHMDLPAESLSRLTVKNSLILTTRAGSQKSYFESVSQLLGFAPRTLELKDHLSSAKLEQELLRLDPSVTELVVGFKEAVKLTRDFVALKNSGVLEHGRFRLHVVKLNLKWPQEKIRAQLFMKGIS